MTKPMINSYIQKMKKKTFSATRESLLADSETAKSTGTLIINALTIGHKQPIAQE